jgi:hypothetical protein
MNKEMIGTMGKTAAITVIIGLGLAAGPSAFGGEILSFSANEAVASTTSAKVGPAVYAVDGNPGTSWSLDPAASGGWLEARLSTKVFMYAIDIDGTLADGASLRLSYLDEQGMKRPFAEGFVSSLSGTTRVDVSYERVAATAIIIDLTQPAGGNSAIREIKVVGERSEEVSRIIEPESVEASENTSP